MSSPGLPDKSCVLLVAAYRSHTGVDIAADAVPYPVHIMARRIG